MTKRRIDSATTTTLEGCCASGDRDSVVEEILRTTVPRVKRRLQRWTLLNEHDVEDLLSATLLMLIERFGRLHNENLQAWYAKKARYAAVDLVNQKREQATQHLELEFATSTTKEGCNGHEVARCGRSQQVREFLAKLAESDRDILLASVDENNRWAAEMEDDTGVKAGTLRVRAFRLRATLQKEMSNGHAESSNR